MSQATLSERPYVNSNLFSGHYLDERVSEREEWDCDDPARQAMEELRTVYEFEGSSLAGIGEDALVDNWIGEVLEILGFGTHEEATLPDGGGFVDELLFDSPTARREAMDVFLDTEDETDVFERAVGILEAKQWDADFTVQFSEQRPYRNASHQTKHYLEKTPRNIQWGILTNGRKWRLYGTNDYETQTYYEVDLPELLERGDLEAFKYFYVFFRPAAFRETAGTTFLDEVWSESETASQELGETLQDNVFTALRVLGKGFVETNDDLDIDPEDEDALDELKEQSLVFLYRLMFVLYAESRGLIHPDDRSAQDEYDQNFSLDQLRLDIHDDIGEVDAGFAEEFSDYSTTMWSRLEDLFRLIDEGEEALGIPPYNGGLFDHETHAFLTEHAVSNRYLAEVIYRLSTTKNDEGRYVLADYADLDTRHLGSVYEGLLEHQFRIAPEQYAAVTEDGGQVWKPATEVSVADAVETVPEGGLYVVNDEGERKATGAYYTPDYVVTYIVEETVGPLVEEIREDLIEAGFEPGTQEYIGPFFDRVTDLRILDPAMGSGHFLTKATGFLSEKVMAEVREAESEFGVAFDEQHVRREIAKECIYGVDLNGMAVELGKLSMWLETLAADRPLAFLDHHFKQGNSLVGSDIEAIEELESDASGDGDQASLATFGATREGTIERLMDIYSEFLAIENETVEDVHEMKRKYAEIEQDELRKRLVAMANVHTAERFDVDVPGGAYERMAKALEDEEEWSNVNDADWFQSAQVTAGEQDFFHWKLAFPEVFYREGGTTREDAGFDAVIGNPPYVSAWNRDLGQNEYFRSDYHSARGHYDLYCLFIEEGVNRLRQSGRFSLIIPDTFCGQAYAKNCREILTDKATLETVLDLRDQQVFEDPQVKNIVFTARADNGDYEEVTVETTNRGNKMAFESSHTFPYRLLSSENDYRIPLSEQGLDLGIRDKVTKGVKLDDVFYISKGMEPHTADGESKYQFIDKEGPAEGMEPYIEGKHIQRWQIHSNWHINYSPEDHKAPAFRELFEARKIVGVRTIGEGRPMFAVDERGYYNNEKTLNAVPYEDLQSVQQRYSQISIDQSNVELGAKFSLYAIVSILNSTLTNFVFKEIESGALDFFPRHLKKIHVPLPDSNPDYDDAELRDSLRDTNVSVSRLYPMLDTAARKMNEHHRARSNLNVDLLDYLGAYKSGSALPDIGFFQPTESNILDATAEEYENLRVGRVDTTRDGSEITIHASARYKPEDEDDHETDRWGYTETEPMPAMRLTDLTETEADLVEAFVPVAVEKAGGFAGFRETATKTNSLVDRLKAITLPDPEDVADDLARYRDAVERAAELDEKIQRTDDLIDEIVYELYGLTEEEIEIVEDAVGDD